MSAHIVTNTNAALEWDAAASSAPGEQVLGDRAVVACTERQMLLAVIDGVGHGAEAAAAAQIAAYNLKHSAEEDVASAVLECHRVLHDTRGAAMSLASIDVRAHAMTWLGVGNVEARLLRGAQPVPVIESLLLRSGVVGHELPPLSAQTTPIGRGDVVIFATDGIRRDFADLLAPSGSCREIAEGILHHHALGSDDALVLVVRYLGRK